MDQESLESADRVDLRYKVEVYGEERFVFLPFVIGVIADLHGTCAATPQPSLEERKFREFDLDNLDDRIRGVRPSVRVPLDNCEEAEWLLTFKELTDFEPLGIAKQVDFFRKVLDKRTTLAELRDKLVAKESLRTLLHSVIDSRGTADSASEDAVSLLPVTPDGEVTGDAEGLAPMLFPSEVLDQLDASPERAQKLLKELSDELSHGTIDAGAGLIDGLDTRVAALDEWLGARIAPILHHPDFQRLEAAWRGVEYLVRNVATSEKLKVRCFSASEEELGRDLSLAQRVLYDELCKEEFGQFGGEPCGLLVCNFSFSQSIPDMDLLEVLAGIAAQADMVLLSGVSPHLFDCEDIGQLPRKRRLLHLPKLDEYAQWRRFRQDRIARHVGLVLPRVLGREPHLDAGTQFGHFRFVESPNSSEEWPWMNPAFVLAAQVAQAYERHGWPGSLNAPETGAFLRNLPTWDSIDEFGHLSFCCPVEVELGETIANQLAALGLICLRRREDSDAAFIECFPTAYAPNSNRPHVPPETADLVVMLVLCQIARFLRCFFRDKFRCFRSPEDLLAGLNGLLQDYVQIDLEAESEGDVAKLPSVRPLASATVQSVECAGLQTVDGIYQSRRYSYEVIVWVQPTFQMSWPMPLLPLRLRLVI